MYTFLSLQSLRKFKLELWCHLLLILHKSLLMNSLEVSVSARPELARKASEFCSYPSSFLFFSLTVGSSQVWFFNLWSSSGSLVHSRNSAARVPVNKCQLLSLWFLSFLVFTGWRRGWSVLKRVQRWGVILVLSLYLLLTMGSAPPRHWRPKSRNLWSILQPCVSQSQSPGTIIWGCPLNQCFL